MGNKIHVIIDARMVDKHLHGIARYTYELIRHGNLSGEIKYTLLVNNIAESREIFKGVENLDFIEMKSKFLSLMEQIELPRIINKVEGEVIFHSPSFVASPFIKKPMIMTIHDLNHMRFPQFYTPFHKYYYKYIVKTSAEKCKKILTVSEFSKKELQEWMNCKEDKIVVTYNGIDPVFRVIKENDRLEEVKRKYSLPEKFVLYIGNLKPHKNVETLVKAMKDVRDQDVYLVINGKPNESMQKAMDESGTADRVKFIGFVDDEDLPCLYNLAKVFVFPSLYEGFGLPPLEAMACGCPTAVSSSSSLPEVTAGASLYFEPLDSGRISEHINTLIEQKETTKKLIDKGFINAGRFTWKETAEPTLEIYKNIKQQKVEN